MSKTIYLEPDEEITDVVDKISKAEGDDVSLVIPRGSTLANSVVNLKLLNKRSGALGKNVALITNDKIAHNLASQIGLSVYKNVDDAKAGVAAKAVEKVAPEKSEVPEEPQGAVEEVDGIKVHKYDSAAAEAGEVIEPTEEEIAPAEPEVIEAVRDADDDGSAAEEHEEQEPIETAERHEKPSDFKLMKKPLSTLGGGMDNHQNGTLFGNMKNRGKRRKIIVSSIIAATALLAIFGLYVFLPEAKVTVSVASEPFSSSAEISVDRNATEVSSASTTIPGKMIEKEEELEKEFTATGEKNIGQKASGKITVYNNWDQQAITLAAGAKFASAGGINFVSTADATIPGAQVGLVGGQFVITASGTVEVNVEALDVGEAGNIGPTDFTITSIPKIQQSKIYGKSTAAMKNGTNKMVKVVSAKDISDAKASTEGELKDSITETINGELSDSEKLLDSALSQTVVSEESSKKENDQSDNFKYKVRMKVQALTFSEADFRQILLENTQNQLASDKAIVSDKIEDIRYEVKSSDLTNGIIVLDGKFDGFIADKYDVNAMRNDIQRKSIAVARNKLTAYKGVLSVDIVNSPRFLHSLPWRANRIEIDFNYGGKE